MDVGASDLGPLKQMQTLAPELKAKGFTVELHTRPGGHDFATWGNGLADALPWASARFYS
jgi:enterochelin esterase-like enzyme